MLVLKLKLWINPSGTELSIPSLFEAELAASLQRKVLPTGFDLADGSSRAGTFPGA